MSLVDDLVDELALHLRHMAAIDQVAELETIPERQQLLVDVLWPRERLREASRAAARAKLAQKDQARGLAA